MLMGIKLTDLSYEAQDLYEDIVAEMKKSFIHLAGGKTGFSKDYGNSSIDREFTGTLTPVDDT